MEDLPVPELEAELVFKYLDFLCIYFVEALEKLGLRLSLAGATLLHSGGWKKLEALKVGQEEFRDRLLAATDIRSVINFYGMVEQVGSVYFENSLHFLHASVYSDIIVRDTNTLEPLPPGRAGLIQVISALPESYPGHSLLRAQADELRGKLRLSLGSQLDNLTKTDLVARVDELTDHNSRVLAETHQLRSDNADLSAKATELEDDLAAARTSLRRMIRAENPRYLTFNTWPPPDSRLVVSNHSSGHGTSCRCWKCRSGLLVEKSQHRSFDRDIRAEAGSRAGCRIRTGGTRLSCGSRQCRHDVRLFLGAFLLVWQSEHCASIRRTKPDPAAVAGFVVASDAGRSGACRRKPISHLRARPEHH